MRKVSKVFVVCFISLSAPLTSPAQEFADLLGADIGDATLYLKEYIDPFMTGFGYGAANGWYNTAKPHQPLGFDLTFTTSLAFVPDKDLFFDFDGFDRLSIESGSDQLPTLFGPRSSTILRYDTDKEATYIDPDPASTTFGQSITRDELVTGDFEAPEGLDLKRHIGFNFVPVPMIQMGVGLIEHTDLKIRFMPSVTADDFVFNFYGFGIMHDFKQWTPGISHLPFDASILVGWNRLKAEATFEDVDVAVSGGQPEVAGYTINSFTTQLIVSKKLSIFTLYGGVGYSQTNSRLGVLGDYEFEGTSDVTLTDGSVTTVDVAFSETDPLNLKFNNSGPRATIGLRIKLLVLTFHLDYTFQEYRTATAGIGVNIR